MAYAKPVVGTVIPREGGQRDGRQTPPASSVPRSSPADNAHTLKTLICDVWVPTPRSIRDEDVLAPYLPQDFLPRHLPATVHRLRTDWRNNSDLPSLHPRMLVLEEATRNVGASVEQLTYQRTGITPSQITRESSRVAWGHAHTSSSIMRGLVEGYLHTLATLRDFGGHIVHTPHDVHPDTDSPLNWSPDEFYPPILIRNALYRTQRYFPTDWIHASNSQGRLAVVVTPPHPLEGSNYRRNVLLSKIVEAEPGFPTANWWESKKKRVEPVGRYDTITITPHPALEDLTCSFVHEFAHRCEDVNHTIGAVERVFLARRAGNGDGFVSSYMGRKYPGFHPKPNVFHEVFTTGMEAVFGGRYGYLHGVVASTPSDAEHRHLVLGILTVA